MKTEHGLYMTALLCASAFLLSIVTAAISCDIHKKEFLTSCIEKHSPLECQAAAREQ